MRAKDMFFIAQHLTSTIPRFFRTTCIEIDTPDPQETAENMILYSAAYAGLKLLVVLEGTNTPIWYVHGHHENMKTTAPLKITKRVLSGIEACLHIPKSLLYDRSEDLDIVYYDNSIIDLIGPYQGDGHPPGYWIDVHHIRKSDQPPSVAYYVQPTLRAQLAFYVYHHVRRLVRPSNWHVLV